MCMKTGKFDLKNSTSLVRTVQTKNVIKKVQKRFQRKARQNVRKIVRQLGISKGSLRRIVKEDLGFYPYPITIQPKLSSAQKRAGITFVNWIRQVVNEGFHPKNSV